MAVTNKTTVRGLETSTGRIAKIEDAEVISVNDDGTTTLEHTIEDKWEDDAQWEDDLTYHGNGVHIFRKTKSQPVESEKVKLNPSSGGDSFYDQGVSNVTEVNTTVNEVNESAPKTSASQGTSIINNVDTSSTESTVN